MESNPVTLMVVLFVGLAIGYFSAFLLRALANDDPAARKGNVLLSRNKENYLIVEMEGKAIPSVKDLDDEQYVRLKNMASDLNKWLGQPVSAAGPSQAVNAPVAVPSFSLPSPILFTASGAGQPPASPAAPAKASTPVSTPLPTPALLSPAAPPDAGAAEKPLKFSMNPMDMIQTVTDRGGKPKAAAAISIIAQVDAILQARILGTPFEKSGIRLIEKPDHTMEIEVGLNKYDGIDAVPSADIRSLIRSCVNEWTSLSNK
ncbi:MAG: hypothetical protein ACOYYS_06735 [Chloroflexota bacterium]